MSENVDALATLTGLNRYRDQAARIATEHKFTDASVGEDAALIASEVSEMLEDHRDGHAATKVWYEEKVPAFFPNGEPIMVDGKQATVAVRHSAMTKVNPPTILKPCGIPSEMADVVIRVLHFCGKHGIDIERAVYEKMLYNETRPIKHGGKTL